MIMDAYRNGCAAAQVRFKISGAGPTPMTPSSNATGAAPNAPAPRTAMTPTTSAAPPIAAGAPKAHVLG